MTWSKHALGDVIRIDRVGVQPEQILSGTLYVGLENITSDGVFDGGDRIAKTIIFAKNHQHAVFIQERFEGWGQAYARS